MIRLHRKNVRSVPRGEKALRNSWLWLFFIQIAIGLCYMSDTAPSNEGVARDETNTDLTLLKPSGKTDIKTQIHRHSWLQLAKRWYLRSHISLLVDLIRKFKSTSSEILHFHKCYIPIPPSSPVPQGRLVRQNGSCRKRNPLAASVLMSVQWDTSSGPGASA